MKSNKVTKMSKKLNKKCIICGKEFSCYKCAKKVTCSAECRSEYAKRRNIGKSVPKEVRQKISAKAKGRDMTELQAMAVDAIKTSPNTGKFETNVNAIDWHLISPTGVHYRFHSLNNWLREYGKDLFGVEPDTKEFVNVCTGISGAKRAMLGKTYNCCTYKGWQVLPTDEDERRFYSKQYERLMKKREEEK